MARVTNEKLLEEINSISEMGNRRFLEVMKLIGRTEDRLNDTIVESTLPWYKRVWRAIKKE